MKFSKEQKNSLRALLNSYQLNLIVPRNATTEVSEDLDIDRKHVAHVITGHQINLPVLTRVIDETIKAGRRAQELKEKLESILA